MNDRLVSAVVAPYAETSFLVGAVGGLRFGFGCFTASVAGRRVPLMAFYENRSDPEAEPELLTVGYSITFVDQPAGLIGTFVVNRGQPGDKVLDDIRNGYLPGVMPEWDEEAAQHERAADGATLLTSAELQAVRLVGLSGWQEATVFLTTTVLPPPPDVNLDPVPQPWLAPG